MGNVAQATKQLTEALRVDPDCAPAARALKLVRKAEALRNAGNEAFKEGCVLGREGLAPRAGCRLAPGCQISILHEVVASS